MEDFGIDIITVKSTQNQYFIGERHFEIPELKLLIDAVLSSKFITAKRSDALIKKLKQFMSEHQSAGFERQVYVTDQIKPNNESIYLAIDVIHTAINRNRQIAFKYYEYTPQKVKSKKHEGFLYHFSPYSMVWNEDKYYALGYSDRHGRIVTFRVDRMCEVTMLETVRVPCPDDFNVVHFCRQVFEMYDGEPETIELRCRNELMKVMIDRFGETVQTKVIDDEWFKMSATVSISPIFFGWLFQFTGLMTVLSPESVIERYRSMLESARQELS